jgi:hypothetical protein
MLPNENMSNKLAMLKPMSAAKPCSMSKAISLGGFLANAKPMAKTAASGAKTVTHFIHPVKKNIIREVLFDTTVLMIKLVKTANSILL